MAVEINPPPRENYGFEEWINKNNEIRKSILNGLSNDEFIFLNFSNTRSSTARHFIGNVSKKGLITLSNDERVKWIETYPKYAYPA